MYLGPDPNTLFSHFGLFTARHEKQLLVQWEANSHTNFIDTWGPGLIALWDTFTETVTWLLLLSLKSGFSESKTWILIHTPSNT